MGTVVLKYLLMYAFHGTETNNTLGMCCLQVTLGDPELDGFKLRLIDTCGVEDPEAGDTVNYPVGT